MAQQYHPEQRSLQDQFDTRRLADRLAESTSDVINETFKAFIEKRDMFFVATANKDGWPESSYKGGTPGFVRVVDERTLVFPVYNGNGMFLSAGNLVANPKIGLLFIDFEGGSRLRMSGHASTMTSNRGTMPGQARVSLPSRKPVSLRTVMLHLPNDVCTWTFCLGDGVTRVAQSYDVDWGTPWKRKVLPP